MTKESVLATLTVLVPHLGLAGAITLLSHGMVSACDLMLFSAFYLTSFVGITVGFHRLLTHRAFQVPKWLRGVLTICGCMAAQGPPIFWVAAHRKHHKNSDGPGDPHSPFRRGGTLDTFRGLFHAHTGWMLSSPEINFLRYAPDIARDAQAMRLGRLYWLWVFTGLLLPAVIGCAVSGNVLGLLSGLVWGGLARLCVAHHMTWSINSLAHCVGSRPYETNDLSTNVLILSLPSLGESWHNNHHAFPNSARHGLRWWQFDPSYYLIYSLRVVRLAWDVKTPLPNEKVSFRAMRVLPKVGS